MRYAHRIPKKKTNFISRTVFIKLFLSNLITFPIRQKQIFSLHLLFFYIFNPTRKYNLICTRARAHGLSPYYFPFRSPFGKIQLSPQHTRRKCKERTNAEISSPFSRIPPDRPRSPRRSYERKPKKREEGEGTRAQEKYLNFQ